MIRAALLAPLVLLAACTSPPVDNCDGAVCKRFETYETGTPPTGMWEADTQNASIAIDTERAYAGNKSVRFELAGKGRAFITTGGYSSGRMKVFLEAAPEGDVHWTLVEAKGRRPSDDYIAELRIGGQHPVAEGSRLLANYETPEGYDNPAALMSDCWQHAEETDVMPTGRWTEIAWRMGDGATLQVSIDGVPVPALTVQGVGQGCVHQPADFAWEMPVIDTVNLGWESYQFDGPRRLWIDDVVLGD